MGKFNIDMVDAAYGAGSSLIGRVLSFFLSGWLGLLIGVLATSFREFSDFLDAGEIFLSHFSSINAYDALVFVFWPMGVLYYALTLPLYGIPLGLIVFTSTIKIFFSDDPVLFWVLMIITSLSLGPVLSEGHLASWVVLLFLWVGLFAAKWWAVQNLHPEWIDWVEERFRRDEDEEE